MGTIPLGFIVWSTSNEEGWRSVRGVYVRSKQFPEIFERPMIRVAHYRVYGTLIKLPATPLDMEERDGVRRFFWKDGCASLELGPGVKISWCAGNMPSYLRIYPLYSLVLPDEAVLDPTFQPPLVVDFEALWMAAFPHSSTILLETFQAHLPQGYKDVVDFFLGMEEDDHAQSVVRIVDYVRFMDWISRCTRGGVGMMQRMEMLYDLFKHRGYIMVMPQRYPPNLITVDHIEGDRHEIHVEVSGNIIREHILPAV